jgi:hypothetical protein
VSVTNKIRQVLLDAKTAIISLKLMRLYVCCVSCGSKIYVASRALTRAELPETFILRCPICDGVSTYRREDVCAEQSDVNSVGAALAGGLLGLVAGGIGVIIGALAGGLLGENFKNRELNAVQRFNES